MYSTCTCTLPGDLLFNHSVKFCIIEGNLDIFGSWAARLPNKQQYDIDMLETIKSEDL